MIFKTKYDRVFGGLFLGIVLFLALLNLIAYFDQVEAGLVLSLIFLPILFLMFLSGLSLKIMIVEHDLIVKILGISFYKVNIRKINKIKIGETMWSGLHKYGTSANGIIIFSKYKNDCYITPTESKQFLEALLVINPHIIIEKT